MENSQLYMNLLQVIKLKIYFQGALFLTKKITVNGSQIKFEIWDTAGQERYHALTPMYYRNANAAIIVFDVSNGTSFERAQKW